MKDALLSLKSRTGKWDMTDISLTEPSWRRIVVARKLLEAALQLLVFGKARVVLLNPARGGEPNG
jgi:hypothetical protein